MPLASPAAARSALSVWGPKMTSAAPYGDGGFETLEDANTADRNPPSAEEVKNNRQRTSDVRILTGERKDYAARFTCGSYIIHVLANPSRGADARQLIAKLDAKLRSQNVCASSARAQPTVLAPPLAAKSERGGTRYYEGRIAQEILAAKAAGSRYLVVVDRYEDKSQNCIVEERAWVGTPRGSDGGRVDVVVGPTISVCVGGNVVSAEQVNKSEADLQVARNNLAKALQRKEEISSYLRDPKFRAQGMAQLKKVEEWISYYEKVIAAIQKGLAASVP